MARSTSQPIATCRVCHINQMQPMETRALPGVPNSDLSQDRMKLWRSGGGSEAIAVTAVITTPGERIAR